MSSSPFVSLGKTERISDPVTPDEEDLSIDILTSDLVNLVAVLFPESKSAPSLLVRKPMHSCFT